VIPPKHRKKAGIVAICIACIAPAEGLRRVAYSDPVGIPTYCFGETQRPDGARVQLGDRASTEECEAMLAGRLSRDFIPGVEGCIHRPMPDKRKAAFVSLGYNIGITAFCESSVATKYNEGDVAGACDAILNFNKARKAGILVVLPGLVKRRGQERELCMDGLT
jgi:lysozyme